MGGGDDELGRSRSLSIQAAPSSIRYFDSTSTSAGSSLYPRHRAADVGLLKSCIQNRFNGEESLKHPQAADRPKTVKFIGYNLAEASEDIIVYFDGASKKISVDIFFPECADAFVDSKIPSLPQDAVAKDVFRYDYKR